jgi:hypothetical protein
MHTLFQHHPVPLFHMVYEYKRNVLLSASLVSTQVLSQATCLLPYLLCLVALSPFEYIYTMYYVY